MPAVYLSKTTAADISDVFLLRQTSGICRPCCLAHPDLLLVHINYLLCSYMKKNINC